MKLLLTTDTVGGVWTYAIGLAAGLQSAGVRIALATMGGAPSADQRLQVEGLPHVTLFESTYKLEWMADCWEDVAAAGAWLLRIADEFRPDVVHLNGYVHGALAWDAPVLMVAHSDVLSWWEAVKQEPAPAEWDRYRRAVRAGLMAADRIVAPSAAMLGEIDRLYGPLGKSSVIYNGCDRSEETATAKEPIILSAGRLWDEAKNLATLDRAAAGLEWPVYVAGDANGFDGNPASAVNVRSLGRLDPEVLRGWMERASIYALPARYEPFGLSVLEAALCGCALVLGDISSLREIWGNAASYIAPDDEEGLRSAVQRLIDDAGLRTSMAEAAKLRAKRYTTEAMARAYRAEYCSLTSDGGEHPRTLMRG